MLRQQLFPFSSVPEESTCGITDWTPNYEKKNIKPTAITPPPSSPHQSPHLPVKLSSIFPSKKPRNILKNPPSVSTKTSWEWVPSSIGKSELYLPLYFPHRPNISNIGRITKMVDFLSSLGKYLGSVGGYDFYEFPELDRLAMVSETELREAGFGYRAKYIIGTVEALQSKFCGGLQWLAALRELNLKEAVDALASLPGVGPKVAACIALFSLDQYHAIPVDTHVWQIATQYLIPELSGTRLTPQLCSRVADVFVSKYGKYAGWAQTLLFIAELPSQKAALKFL